MKVIITLITLVSLISCSETRKVIKDERLNVHYTLEKGRLNGLYTSFYDNGQKLAEGLLKNNYRCGIWKAWDSLGNLVVQRNYSSPFEYDRILPKSPNEGVGKLMSKPVYVVENNKQGYKSYFHIKERMIVWSKRLWRTIPKENNKALFEGKLWNKILGEALSGNISIFSPNNDEFKEVINFEDLNLEESELVAFKIKEDWFFDNERFLMESRVIGVCPVIMKEGQTKDAFWLYYPEIRPLLTSIKTKNNEGDVKNLDDLFFYRDFSSSINKESNVYDQEISDYMKDDQIKREAMRIELEIYNCETKLWLNFAGVNLID